jgi:cytidylate kinase
MNERDRMDSQRSLDPMKRADDAFDVDTSHLSLEQACEKILEKFNSIK